MAEDGAEESVNFFAGHSFDVKEGHTGPSFILKGVGGGRLCHVKHYLNFTNISKELSFVYHVSRLIQHSTPSGKA
jgi:hypothetical protein